VWRVPWTYNNDSYSQLQLQQHHGIRHSVVVVQQWKVDMFIQYSLTLHKTIYKFDENKTRNLTHWIWWYCSDFDCIQRWLSSHLCTCCYFSMHIFYWCYTGRQHALAMRSQAICALSGEKSHDRMATVVQSAQSSARTCHQRPWVVEFVW